VSNFQRELFSPTEALLYDAARLLGAKDLFYRLYQRCKPPRADIARFAGIHRGQRCFILGSGPSLRKLDPEPLAGECTFGVNGVFLIHDWLGFEPTYYAVEDRLVYEDRFDDIRQRVRRSTCFFPIQFSCERFDRPSHHYLRALYELGPGVDWPDFSRDASRVVWIGGTVMYVCLQLAFHMGFDRVYLLGVDLDYTKPTHVTERGGEWTSHGDDPNHFHPDYFGKGYRWHDPRTDRMELAFRKARRVFEADGRRIYNATPGGKLEVFERVPYDSLF
jgi:hypothetical protein